MNKKQKRKKIFHILHIIYDVISTAFIVFAFASVIYYLNVKQDRTPTIYDNEITEKPIRKDEIEQPSFVYLPYSVLTSPRFTETLFDYLVELNSSAYWVFNYHIHQTSFTSQTFELFPKMYEQGARQWSIYEYHYTDGSYYFNQGNVDKLKITATYYNLYEASKLIKEIQEPVALLTLE